MRLRRFKVEGFAQFGDEEIAFRDDAPNLIIGANETGKSHLMQAFYGMFFGIDKPSLYLPWFGPPSMRGVLELEDSKRRLVRLERALDGKDVTVCVDGDEPWNGKVSGKDGVRFAGCLDEWLGFRDKQVFTSTTFVQQADVIRADLGNVAGEVKRLITGTMETNYEQALQDLETELNGLRKKPGAHNPRTLEQKQTELDQLREAYRLASEQQEAFSHVQKQRDDLQAALQQKEGELRVDEERLDRGKDLVQAERDLTDLTKQLEELQEKREQLEQVRAKLGVAERTREDLQAVKDTDAVTLNDLRTSVEAADKRVKELEPKATAPDLDTLERLNRVVTAAEAEARPLPEQTSRDDLSPSVLTQLDRAVEDAETRLQRAQQYPSQGASASMQSTWLIAGLGTLLVLILTILVHPAALFLLVVVAGFVAYRYWNAQAASPSNTERSEAQAALAVAQQSRAEVLARLGVSTVAEALDLRTQFDAADNVLSQARQERSDALASLGVATTTDARTLYERYRQAAEERDCAHQALGEVLQQLAVSTVGEALAMRRRYDQAVGDGREASAQLEMLGDPQRLEKDWKRVGLERATKEMYVNHHLEKDIALQSHGSAEARAKYFEALRSQVDELEKDIEQLKDQRADVERQILIRGGSDQDAPVLFLQIQSLETEIAQINQQVEALGIAITTLKDAVDTFQGSCLGGVVTETSHFLKTITDGRYQCIHLDAESLDPTVDMLGKCDIPSSSLSRGVKDQLYFSLRVALTRELAGGRTLPLVLDDPFVNFDPDRLERVMILLGEIAKKIQVILFTCDPQYVRWLEPVKELQRVETPSQPKTAPEVA